MPKLIFAKPSRPLVFGILTTLLVVGACELVLRAATTRTGAVERLLGKPWYYLVPFDLPDAMPSVVPEPGAYRVYDPDLGWTLGRFGKSEPLYFSDRDGVRCSRQAFERQSREAGPAGADTAASTRHAVDVVALGDSFTHGDEVSFEDAWPTRLAAGGLDVLNLGVGGYGIDQAILRYEKTPVDASVVILGLIAGDLERAQSQIYNLSRGGLKSKPLFVFEDGKARLENRPAVHGEALRRELDLGAESPLLRRERIFGPRLYQRHVWDGLYLLRVPYSLWVAADYRPPPILTTPGPNHEHSLQILQYGKDLATSRGARFLVVLLGNNNTFALRSTLDDPWTLFKKSLERAEIDFLDTSPSLYAIYRDEPGRVINVSGVHYTPQANELVARQVETYLTAP